MVTEVVIEAWYIRVWHRYQESWFDRNFRFSAPVAIAFFALSVVIQYFAGTYATESASNPVTDVVLSNIPVFNVDILFVYGAVALIVFITLLCLLYPRRIPFILHSLTLLILIRSVFISLTHIGPYPDQIHLDLGTITSKFLFGGDLFFSNHTAIPFMMALIFWHQPRLRYFFLACSVLFGVVVLLGHLHYTIDVLSAFFITYGVYCISLWLFPREWALFLSGE